MSVEWLEAAIGRANRSAKFCVSGCLPKVDPGLVVDEVGAVRLPAKPAIVKKLIAVGKVAPYGKGTRTLVNTDVRNAHELDPKQFRLGDEWNAAVADTVRNVAEILGLPTDRLEAHLYKLLVYQRGGFLWPTATARNTTGCWRA